LSRRSLSAKADAGGKVQVGDYSKRLPLHSLEPAGNEGESFARFSLEPGSGRREEVGV